MKLEVGKHYRTRDGRKVGPISWVTDDEFVRIGFSGAFIAKKDLIAEWQDEPPAQTTRATILDTAKQYVTADRQATHGKPEDTFGLIAAYWSAHLDTPVSASDVAAMMALLKLARAKQNPHNTDNWIDLAGYAACAGELANG